MLALPPATCHGPVPKGDRRVGGLLPFSGFDPINVEIIRSEILRLRNKGATVMLSTHNMGSVEEMCDNIALIENAKCNYDTVASKAN